MGRSPAVGEQGEHGQQQQDEHKDEGERQDEGIQVWGAGGKSGWWECPMLRPSSSCAPTWSLTTSCQQRRRLRPGAPEATEARLGHTRAYHEGVTGSTPEVAQHALSTTIQDLHLGGGGGDQRKGWGVALSQSEKGRTGPKRGHEGKGQ